MEFIAGQNLNQVAEACTARRTPMPLGFIGRVSRDIALALHYAHTFTDPTGKPHPVIHRDVAQKNIMVAYDGRVKLLDFGIAKARGSLGRTQVGTVKGTTGYMSPEQVLGQEIDGRSDVFCLGVVMHELLTGKRLFAADTEEEEMRRILTQLIPRPIRLNPAVPEELSDVVMRALSRERSDRFSSARELAKAIEAVLGKTLFDQERAAAFMRELFASKLVATQALLESVDAKESVFAVEKALVALRNNDGLVFDAPKMGLPPSPQPAADPLPSPEPPVVAGQLLETGDDTAPQIYVPPSATSPTPPPRKAAPPPKPRAARARPSQEPMSPPQLERVPEGRGGPMKAFWIAVFAVLGITVGVGAYATWDAWHPKAPAREDLTGGMKPLDPAAVLSGADQNDAPAPAVTPAPTTSQQSAASSPDGATADDAPEKDATSAPVTQHARRKVGRLTLVTSPACEVFYGRKKLGKTPLFNASLPAGLHVLHLRGPDKKMRRLSVPIHADRTTAMKIALSDLPVF
jgi:serine/threonine-protein kinase